MGRSFRRSQSGTGKILIPTTSPDDWRRLLADPNSHWRTGYSAKTLAYCWEAEPGFPRCVRRVFEDSGVDAFADIEMLIGIPEHQTPLPGGRRAAQADIFVLARNCHGLMAITVEGKVDEPFGPLVSDWRSSDTPGKKTRLKFLCGVLGLELEQVDEIRYQLLHRTASAILEAGQYAASQAMMLVHSFSQDDAHVEDYASFLRLFGVKGEVDRIVSVGEVGGVHLYFGWVRGDPQYLLA